MEHASQVALWLLINRKRLNFKAVDLSWIRDYGFNMWDYSVSIQIDGHDFLGRGSDSNENTAIEKAFTEAIERYALSQIKEQLTTNGMAVHITHELADAAAIRELIERHLFLTYFHQDIPFSQIENEHWHDLVPRETHSRLATAGVKFSAYSLYQSEKLSSVMVTAFGLDAKHPFGIIIGLGTKDNFKDAFLAAQIEMLRHLSFLLSDSNRITPITLEQFSSLERVTFEDHGNLALNGDYFKKIEHLFTIRLPQKIDITNDIKIERKDLKKFSFLEGIPLCLSIAKSEKVLNLYLGRPSFNCINTLPHPLR